MTTKLLGKAKPDSPFFTRGYTINLTPAPAPKKAPKKPAKKK